MIADDTTGNKFWDFVGHLIHDPTKEQIECHAPKPILLDIGTHSQNTLLYYLTFFLYCR